MIRSAFLTILLMLACLPGSAAMAQVMVSPAFKKSEPAAAAVRPKTKVLTLHAMDQPDPLLHYRLWPAPEKRRQENPLPFVSRAILLELQLSQESRKQFTENYNNWIDAPLDEFPIDRVRRLLEGYDSVFKELGRAEHLMQLHYNLQLDDLSAPEVVNTLLPEFQEMRGLGRLLTLRARLAMAEQRWDDMVHDLRLGFRLSQVAGHSTNFLIGRLVGFAIAGQMMSVIEEAIQRPNCPNLYWALASIPDEQLFETRQALEFESVLVSRVFKSAGSLPNHPIGEVAAREKLRAVAREATRMMANTVDSDHSVNADFLTGVFVVQLAEPSRDLLAETPEWRDRAQGLSASEAVLRASQLKHARIRDRWVAWSMLPPEAWEEYEPERKSAFGSSGSQLDVLQSLVRSLMPAVNAARFAGRRTHQQRNFLLTVEAIRMHAADHGTLPESLDRLRPVPPWMDAIAIRPFGYQRSSETTATLTRAPRFNGDPNTSIQIVLKGSK